MNRQLLSLLIALNLALTARGEGSMFFNGATARTSKLEHTDADILEGSDEMTICAWIYKDGVGEDGVGMVLGIDEETIDEDRGLWLQQGGTKKLALVSHFETTTGVWFIPITEDSWNAVAIAYRHTNDEMDDAPRVRVDFADVTAPEDIDPAGDPVPAADGYCIGNLTGNAHTWDGKLAHVQIFNRRLSAAEMDACLRAPGSVKHGLRLWLPMTNASDFNDRSGNDFHATAIDVETGDSGPIVGTQSDLPVGVVQLRTGDTSVTQHEISRYANGTTPPAAQLRGFGPASVLRGTAATGSLPSSRRAIVITEDYDYPNNIDYWQAGAFGLHEVRSVDTCSAGTGSVITIETAGNHGLTTGQTVRVSGVVDFDDANTTRTITVTDLDEFTLDGTSSSGSSSGSGTVYLVGYPFWQIITGVSNSPSPPTTITTVAPHRRADGEIVTIEGVPMAGPNINGTHIIDVTGSNTFTVPVTTTGSSSGGRWIFDQGKAVLRPEIRDLTIAGYEDTSNNYADGGIVGSDPAIHHKVRGAITSISGTGTVTVTSPAHTLSNGKNVKIIDLNGYTLSSGQGPYTITVSNANTFTFTGTGSGSGTGIWTSEDSWSDREHGALVHATGANIENVNFFYIPGTCLKVSAGNAATNRNGSIRPFDSEKTRIWNCQFMRAYRGAEIAIVDAVVGRLNGFGLRDYGIKFVGGATQIEGALHFYGVGEGGVDQPAVWFASTAGPCWGGPIYAESSPVGIQMDNSGNKLTGVYSHSCTLRNIWITGERNSIQNFEIDVRDGITESNGGEGVLIAYQTNTLSTGTIGGGQYGPVPAGEIAVRVKGTNAGNRQVIRDVTFSGTAASSAPLISIEETLTDSTIIIKCFSAGTILDLYTNMMDRLGTGNYISITTAGTVSSAVNLDPGGWDDTNNSIIIDGVKQVSP